MRVVVFGAGEYGRDYARGARKEHDLVAFVDNSDAKAGTQIDGIAVHHASSLASLEFDRVHVCSSWSAEIVPQLTDELGIEPGQIHVVPPEEKAEASATDVDRDAIYSTVAQTLPVLSRAGIPAWLDHSGLLSLVRHGDLTSLADIEFAIEDTGFAEASRVLTEHLGSDAVRVSGYAQSWKYWEKGADALITVATAPSVRVQFHNKHVVKGVHYWLVGPVVLAAPTTLFGLTSVRQHRGMNLLLPDPAEEYLELLYGDWETPDPSFTYYDYGNIAAFLEYVDPAVPG